MTATTSAQTNALRGGCSLAGQLSPAADPPVQLLLSSNLSSANPAPLGLHINCHAQSRTVIEMISISILTSARLCTARREIYVHSFLKCCNSQKCSIRHHTPTDKFPRKNKIFFSILQGFLVSKVKRPCYLPELLLENLRMQNLTSKLSQKSNTHINKNIQTNA